MRAKEKQVINAELGALTMLIKAVQLKDSEREIVSRIKWIMENLSKLVIE